MTNNPSPVQITREPPIGWLTFNRPEKLNAFNLAAWKAIPERLAELEADDAIRVIVIHGAGDRAFAAGADIGEFEQHRRDPTTATHYAETNERAFRSLRECTKPTIAMIQGICIGGGCAVALNIDIRIAAADARFAITPARLGLGYSHAGIELAVSELGPAAARYLFLTAAQVDAAKALQLGLVQEVHPPDKLRERTIELAHQIASNAPLTLRAVKASITEARRAAARDPARIETVETLIRACFASEDYKEGLAAFAEKRKPKFTGR